MAVSLRRMLVGALLPVVALVVSGCSVNAGSATTPNAVPRATAAASSRLTAVAIGDSVMDGHGLDPAQAWPALLAARYGWNLVNLASDGSGFVTKGDDGDIFADQVNAAIAHRPDIVIVSGSSNDLGVPGDELTAAIDSTLARMRAALPDAQIVVVSPVWSDSAVPPELDEIAAEVRSAATTIHATVLSIGQPLADRADLLQDDEVHPTPEGQQDIADSVAGALQASGIEP